MTIEFHADEKKIMIFKQFNFMIDVIYNFKQKNTTFGKKVYLFWQKSNSFGRKVLLLAEKYLFWKNFLVDRKVFLLAETY